nr:Arc family DNA-binding protein [Devosia sp.]
MLRLPDGMRDRIAEVAKANGRSMNSEIVARLEESFSSNGIGKIDINELVDALEDRFGPLNLGKKP